MSYLPVISALPPPGTAEPEKAATSQCSLQVDLAAGAHSSLWHKHNQQFLLLGALALCRCWLSLDVCSHSLQVCLSQPMYCPCFEVLGCSQMEMCRAPRIHGSDSGSTAAAPANTPGSRRIHTYHQKATTNCQATICASQTLTAQCYGTLLQAMFQHAPKGLTLALVHFSSHG